MAVLLPVVFVGDLLTKTYSISFRSVAAVCISPVIAQASNPPNISF